MGYEMEVRVGEKEVQEGKWVVYGCWKKGGVISAAIEGHVR
jgi:hypothetical protein